MDTIKGISFNSYHKQYYHDKIKGEKKICDCGLMVDKFRFARHFRTKKHLKNMELKELEKNNIEKMKIL